MASTASSSAPPPVTPQQAAKPAQVNKNVDDIRSCLVLYATQSGRAKACARRTSRILAERCYGSDQQVSPPLPSAPPPSSPAFQVSASGYRSIDDKYRGMNDVVEFASQLQRVQNDGHGGKTLLVLFVSTTGDGEQTDSMQQIWKQLLQKSLPSNLFHGVPVAVFCLGDRAYGDQFCAAGRKLAVRLLQLGATMLCNVGYGDDGTPGGGVFADLEVWLRNELLQKLSDAGKLAPEQQKSTASPDSFVPPSPPVYCPYRVSVLPSSASASGESMSAELQWSDPKYESSYREFMSNLRPLTAYRYSLSGSVQWPVPSVGIRDVTATATGTESLSSFLLKGQVAANQRITAEHWEQNTRHVSLQVSLLDDGATDNDDDIPSKGGEENAGGERRVELLPYRAGDVAAILPCNSAKDVQRFISVLPQRLQDIADRDLEIEYDAEEQDAAFPHWPRRCTLRGWLTLCADIHTLPEREDLRALAAYCELPDDGGNNNKSDDREQSIDLARQQQEKLVALSEPSKAGALYVDYVLRQKRSWADVLYDFDSLRASSSGLSVEALLLLLAPVRPREFSIASSPTKQVNMISSRDFDSKQGSFGVELCVAVVEGKTPLGRSYYGLCSDYISRLSNGSIVRMWIRPGTFHGLPLELNTDDGDIGSRQRFRSPVLFVGAGTGIAPLRGLIQEREAVRQLELVKRGLADEVGKEEVLYDSDVDNLLFFGCRKEKADFYYKNEWDSLTRTGRLNLHTAFSQDQWYKIYVQKVLETADAENRLIASHILERNGAIYIAGGPKMARAVKDQIVDSLANEMGGNEKQAKKILAGLQRLGYLSVEAWG